MEQSSLLYLLVAAQLLGLLPPEFINLHFDLNPSFLLLLFIAMICLVSIYA